MLLTFKSFRKQFQSTTHSVNAGKPTVEYISLQTVFIFNLNVLKFELQYEWTPSQIFFLWIWRFATIFQYAEGAHDIKCSQK